MNKETVTLYARIRPDLRKAVYFAAYESRRKIAAQVEVIIEEWLASREPSVTAEDIATAMANARTSPPSVGRPAPADGVTKETALE